MLDKNILKDILPFKPRLVMVLASDIIQVLMIVVNSYIIAYLANVLLFAKLDYETATPLVVLLFLFFCIKAGLSYANRWQMEKISIKLQADLRYKLLRALAELPTATQRSKGEWIALVTKGIDKLDVYITSFLPQLGMLIVFPIILLLFSFTQDWISGLIFLFTAPLIPGFMILIGKMADKENKRQWAVFQKLTGFMMDFLPGLLVLKAYNQAEYQLSCLEANGKKFSEATLKVLKIAFISAFALEFIATLSIALIAVNIGLRLLDGQAQFLPAFFILLIAPQFYQPLRQFGSAFHDAMNGLTASEEIYELLNHTTTHTITKEVTGELKLAEAPAIIFDKVSFSYGQEAVLKELSFNLKPGEQVVLTGPNGAGKSTIFKLLLKQLEPSSGQITISGEALERLDTDKYLAQIGWVAQTPYIFSTTVAENITLGRTTTAERLQEVVELVNLSEFIDQLPAGLDTEIGGAVKVSSGQARRIGLARALLLSPKLLLLDEPWENLDSRNEELISEVLRKLSGKVTTIIIGHRLQTLNHADTLLCIAQGRVVEMGSPKDLSRRQSGHYYRLLQLAKGGEQNA